MRRIFESIGVALARWSWTIHTHTTFTAQTTLEGQVFKIPVGQGKGLPMLSISPDEDRFVGMIRSLLQDRPGAVLDVGANVGRFMLYTAAADRTRRYVGFDVHPACAHYIMCVAALNRLTESTTLAVGLSDHAGVLTLRTGGDDDVSASVVGGFYDADRFDESLPVCVMDGDTVLAGLDDVDTIALLKIDVEGGELEVVRGLTQAIGRDHPPIIIEVAPYAQDKDPTVRNFRRERIAQLEAVLRDLGYRFFSKIMGGERLVPIITLDPKDSTDTHNMDYLCRVTE